MSLSNPRHLTSDGLLSAAAVDALRRAVGSYAETGATEAELRHAVRLMCVDVHRSDLQAEQLIIAFKDLWRSLPEAQRLPRGGPREHLLERVVTMCVEEYYAPGE